MKTIFKKVEKTEYTLKLYTGPKELSELYKHGDSCMKVRVSELPVSVRRFYDAKQLWNSCFFSYIPDCAGLAIFENDKFFCRTLVQGNNVIGGIYGIRGNEDNTENIAIKLLKDAGYTWWRNIDMPKKFRIHGVLFDGKYYMPVPYIDNGKSHFKVNFDGETKEFIIEPKNHEEIGIINTRRVSRSRHWIHNEELKTYKYAPSIPPDVPAGLGYGRQFNYYA